MIGDGPSFGPWYDFRQRPPLGDYAAFYGECLEEIEGGERLFAAGVVPRVRGAVGTKTA